MKFTVIKMAARNLQRNLRRNMSTGLAIALGFTAIMLVAGYANRIDHVMRQSSLYGMRLGHILITAPGGYEQRITDPGKYSFEPEQQEKIMRIIAGLQGVGYYSSYLQGTGLIGNGCTSYPFIVTGYDARLLGLIAQTQEYREFLRGSDFAPRGEDLTKYPVDFGGISISPGLASLLRKNKPYGEIKANSVTHASLDCNAQSGDSKISDDSNVQLAGLSWDGNFTVADAEVVSIHKPFIVEFNDTEIVAPTEFVQKLYDTRNVNGYKIWFKEIDPKNMDPIVNELKKRLGDAGVASDVYAWNDSRINVLYSTSKIIVGLWFLIISIIIYGVVAMSISNAATMTVMERSQEIGMMRSMGFSQSRIRKVFIIENSIMTLGSILLGAIITVVTISIYNSFYVPLKLPDMTASFNMTINPNIVNGIFAALVAMVLSLGATLLAVWSVSRENIVSLLYKVKA